MSMYVYPKGFLLDEQQGDFVADDGRKVEYHNARFYDVDSQKIFKAAIADGAVLPAPQEVVTLVLEVRAGERYCKLQYESYEG